jgi:hypothetical protein
MNRIDAIELIRGNPFDVQKVPFEIIDEQILRFVRRGNPWAVDAWMLNVSKSDKVKAREISQNVFVDVGITRDYIELI